MRRGTIDIRSMLTPIYSRMEAEQLNLLANKLIDLRDRVSQLRRYL